MVVYMPLGVLSFLLSDEELDELAKNTDEKFWRGVVGWMNYRVQFTREHGYSVDELLNFAKEEGLELAFPIAEE